MGEEIGVAPSHWPLFSGQREAQVGHAGMPAPLWSSWRCRLAQRPCDWTCLPLIGMSSEATCVTWIEEKLWFMNWGELHQFLCFGWEDLVKDTVLAGCLGFSNFFPFLCCHSK